MVENINQLFYPTFLIIIFILTLIFIPRKVYKEYFIYGILLGGLGDILTVFLMQNILGIIWFKNQGIFNVLGQIALSPLIWTMAVMIYLYFLPVRKYFLYPYTITWALISLGFGYTARNVGLFDFVSWYYPIPSYIFFFVWWIAAAWLFKKTSPLANK